MDYRLRPLGPTCAATDAPLQPGAECVSVLVDVDGELRRLDYDAEYWDSEQENPEPDGCLGHWRGVVPEPESEQKTLDADQLMARFEQLAEESAPHQATLTYVLALWLMRRRRLRLTGSHTDDGVEWLTLEGSHGQGPFEIQNQQLSLADAQALQDALLEEGGIAA